MAERPSFNQLLQAKWDEGKFVCVGLDADITNESYPAHLKEDDYQTGSQRFYCQYDFLVDIISATADLALAYKPNIAFFEDDKGGEEALQEIVRYINDAYPDIPVIGDFKRADIGNTNRGYAKTAFERYRLDAMTSNGQYFGSDTFPPFDKYPGKGIILMAKTSNPGSKEVQDMPISLEEAKNNELVTAEECDEIKDLLEGRNPTVYEMVAFMAARRWNKSGNLGLVVGATHPEACAPVRRLAGDMPFLIPGVGKQGGDLPKILQFAPDSKGQGIIINSARDLIFASSGEDFAEAARAATQKLHNQITELRKAQNG